MTIAINLATPGLANRIKTYVSCLSRYDEVRTLKEADNYIFPEIKLASDYEQDTCDKFSNWRFHIDDETKLNEYKYIDLLYEKTPQYFIDKYLKIFNSLVIDADILKYVEEFTQKHNLSNKLGVHIRSWYCDRTSWHDNSLFEGYIDSLVTEEEQIFLCTDNKSVTEHFIKKYGDRIIVHEQEKYTHPHLAESGHNDSIQSNVDAFIDLILLSKCDTIVGTYASTFAEVAWWFSGCNANVIIPKPINISDEFNSKIFERL